MFLKLLNSPITLAIKALSIILIGGGIILQLLDIYTSLQIISSSNILFWLVRFAVVAHFLEALIAVFYARSRNENPFTYSIYTFFVGTVALLELFTKEDTVNHSK